MSKSVGSVLSECSCIAHFHLRAMLDFEAIRDRKERAGILGAVAMLSRNGHRMTMPHARAVASTRGLYELRPKGGRSKYRPLYVAVDDVTFVVLAIAPESQTDGNGFRRAIDRARGLALDAFEIQV